MPRDYRLYLEDILQAIERIERYTQGLDLAAFSADEMRAFGTLFRTGSPFRALDPHYR